MNRYLIAALYVMAGCAVTIPLKAQGNGEPLRRERCRLIITNTVKVVSVYLEEETEVQANHAVVTDNFSFQTVYTSRYRHFFHKTIRLHTGPLCRTSHQIRAPEIK